ncbi:small ribosomal subunit protein uS10m isoform X2 [Brachionichthys hirsutus]|uniref:small ribosomal subunit protein uS10m isoform X2 n=1 Tax=Brachionichthys hirsutus TaxID=412623 RepID=UPI0036047A2B
MTEPRAVRARSGHGTCNTTGFRPPFSASYNPFCFHAATATPSSVTVTDEPDVLIQRLSLLVKGHSRAVLDSYEFFATTAAKELGVAVSNVSEPKKDVARLTLLKSVHIFKKHRVQYEMRTYYRRIQLSRLTGSTAQAYLEYVQRNLPEGVAMEVQKTTMEKVPDHILEPMRDDLGAGR